MKTDKFLEETKIYLKKLISKHAKISADDIDVEEELEVYGIDSLMIINLNKEIEADFGYHARSLKLQFLRPCHGYRQKLFRPELS